MIILPQALCEAIFGYIDSFDDEIVQIKSMDAKSETQFVKKFKESDYDTTLVVITHRTSLLVLVEKVIIMENGKVAGIGSTDQFLKAQTDHQSAAHLILK